MNAAYINGTVIESRLERRLAERNIIRWVCFRSLYGPWKCTGHIRHRMLKRAKFKIHSKTNNINIQYVKVKISPEDISPYEGGIYK